MKQRRVFALGFFPAWLPDPLETTDMFEFMVFVMSWWTWRCIPREIGTIICFVNYGGLTKANMECPLGTFLTLLRKLL